MAIDCAAHQTVTSTQRLISDFVKLRSHIDYPGLSVDRWPDEQNRVSSEIDAIAQLAIEHTSVDTVTNQRRDRAWFMEVVDPLQRTFTDGMSFRLNIVFTYDAIARGHDWHSMRQSLANWIETGAQSLSDGRHRVRLPDFPFEFDAIIVDGQT